MNRDATCLALTGTSILYVGSYTCILSCTFAILTHLKSFYYYHLFYFFWLSYCCYAWNPSKFITFSVTFIMLVQNYHTWSISYLMNIISQFLPLSHWGCRQSAESVMLYSKLMVIYESQSSALLKLTQYDTIFEILPDITADNSNYFLPHCIPRAHFLDTLPKNPSTSGTFWPSAHNPGWSITLHGCLTNMLPLY